jgi:phosphoribosylaminoimidazole-succinocarboxamide synthase
MSYQIIENTHLENLPLIGRGKVRDVYDVGDHYLIVSTDRLSAFDVVFREAIPYKGIVLNKLSEFWFQKTADVITNHYVSTDVLSLYPSLKPFQEILKDRSMLVKKAKPMAFEFIVRGYLMGSAYEQYKKDYTISGQIFPHGLIMGSKFSIPLFTPSTKESSGHDINISFEELMNRIGSEQANWLKEKSIAIFQEASLHALQNGILIADTKFEFGMTKEGFMLIDEIFTPDSSRFILKSDYELGYSDRTMDKQFVRNFLTDMGWNKEPPPPSLPADIVLKTSQRYLEAYRLLTGKNLKPEI